MPGAPDRADLRALRGAKRAIVHFYNSTSTLQRRVVFGLDRDGITDIATTGARLCQKYAEIHTPDTDIYYEYSPSRTRAPSWSTRWRSARR